VRLALREPHRVFALRDHLDCEVLQSPYKPPSANPPISTPRTFAHVLWNAGFVDPVELQRFTEAWDAILASANPDLIVFDHAPTALLAARGRNLRRIVLGNGFCCPPDRSPLPDLRPWMPPEPQRLYEEERRILDGMNQVLQSRGVNPLGRVSQLYGEVDDTFLATLPEFDHYPGRTNARYRGPWTMAGGEPPAWPIGYGKRIYAYLGQFPAREQLLARLIELGNPTIVSVPESDVELFRRLAAPNLRFESRRLDIRQVAAECDLAILNGNHGTTIAMLLEGKPALQLPIFLEQTYNAQAAARLGAGLICSAANPDEGVAKLTQMLHDERFAAAARRFAIKHANFNPQVEIDAAARRIDEMLQE